MKYLLILLLISSCTRVSDYTLSNISSNDAYKAKYNNEDRRMPQDNVDYVYIQSEAKVNVAMLNKSKKYYSDYYDNIISEASQIQQNLIDKKDATPESEDNLEDLRMPQKNKIYIRYFDKYKINTTENYIVEAYQLQNQKQRVEEYNKKFAPYQGKNDYIYDKSETMTNGFKLYDYRD